MEFIKVLAMIDESFNLTIWCIKYVASLKLARAMSITISIILPFEYNTIITYVYSLLYSQ